MGHQAFDSATISLTMYNVPYCVVCCMATYRCVMPYTNQGTCRLAVDGVDNEQGKFNPKKKNIYIYYIKKKITNKKKKKKFFF